MYTYKYLFILLLCVCMCVARLEVVRQSLIKTSELERTTIIISRKNIEKLSLVGNYGETLDDVLNKLVDYDRKLHGSAQQRK